MSTEGLISKEYFEQMNALAHAIDELFNGTSKGLERKTGFVLLCFPFGEQIDGRINYISNGERSDVVNSLKEFLARFQGQIKDNENLR